MGISVIPSSAGGGGAPSGAAGGALGGTYPNPTLANLTTVGAIPIVASTGVLGEGAGTIFTNGAASTPPLKLSGTWFTGGDSTTNKPALLVEPAGTTSTGWSTSGTGIGVNAPSGFVGRLLALQLVGVDKFIVLSTGAVHNVLSIAAPNNTSLTLNSNNISTAIRFAVTLGGGIFSQTSGVNGVVTVLSTYNQPSGTAANTDLLINRVETALGSGAQFLWDAQVGGVSRGSLSNVGLLKFYSATIFDPTASTGATVVSVLKGAAQTLTSATFTSDASASFTGDVIPRSVKLLATTVANLPTSPVAGQIAFITDSNAASFTVGLGLVVAGGGTTQGPVFYDGTNWRIG